MAVTKTHPIKSTLKAAIDYICNPEKTDGKLLVSSYGCAAETADIEFAWTRRHAIDKGTNLGRHLIQAFQPGEVTPEQAHEIGMELAKEILGGKYEFVLTTHIDKDHVHEGLIPSDVWLRCRKKLMTNITFQNGRKARNTWLAGKIKCGKCGYALKTTHNPSGYEYLRCSKRADHKGCPGCGTLRKNEFEQFILLTKNHLTAICLLL